MSNAFFTEDADTLWTSRVVVKKFKDEVFKLRKSKYSKRSGLTRFGKEILVYFDAVGIENEALRKFERGSLDYIEFQQAVLDGIKPLTTSASSRNPTGKHEGAAILALLSDKYPDVAKLILNFSASETNRIRTPVEIVKFRHFQRGDINADKKVELREDVLSETIDHIIDHEQGKGKSEGRTEASHKHSIKKPKLTSKRTKFPFFSKSKDVTQTAQRQGQAEGGKLISFPTKEDVDRLRDIFRNITASPPKSEGIDESKMGKWKIVGQWDASHYVPKRGDGQRYNPPQNIAWRQDGRYIGVACDMSGNCIFDVGYEPRFHPDLSDSAYGVPEFSFWSHDGRFFVSLVKTSQNENWIISDGPFQSGEVILNLPELFGQDTFNQRTKYNYISGRDPFRPGTNEITFVPRKKNVIALLDLSIMQKLRRNSNIDWSDHYRPVLNLSSLGAFENSCFNYHWHSSGLYLAITTCSATQSTKSATSSHVIEISSGKTIGSVRDGFAALAWSPTGQELLTFKRLDPTECRKPNDVFKLLDLNKNTLIESQNASDFGLWAKRAAIQNVPSGPATNATGERVFKHLNPAPDGRLAFQVINIAGSEPFVEFEIAELVQDASWSPIDPNRFAIAGGTDCERDVRIWAIE